VLLRSPAVRDYDVFLNATLRICSQPRGFVSQSSLSDSRCSLRDDHLSETSKNKIVTETVLEVNGIKIRKTVSENRYRPEDTFLDAFFSTKDRDIMVNGSFPRRFGLERYVPVFDQMLLTLQLVEQGSELSYSNARYGFSLEYPGTWKSCPLDNYREKNLIILLVPEDGLCQSSNSIKFLASTPGATDKEWSEERYTYRQRNMRSALGDFFMVREMYNLDKDRRSAGESIIATLKLTP